MLEEWCFNLYCVKLPQTYTVCQKCNEEKLERRNSRGHDTHHFSTGRRSRLTLNRLVVKGRASLRPPPPKMVWAKKSTFSLSLIRLNMFCPRPSNSWHLGSYLTLTLPYFNIFLGYKPGTLLANKLQFKVIIFVNVKTREIALQNLLILSMFLPNPTWPQSLCFKSFNSFCE